MKRKQFKYLIFITTVILLAIVITYYLKVFNHQTSHHVAQNIEVAKKEKIAPDYPTIMNDNNPNYQNIDHYLKQEKFNGAIAVFHQGQLEMNKGYGYQDFLNQKQSSANSMYLIGSAQKFLTGLTLKQLEVQGKVNINDPITKYLPWFKTGEPLLLRDLMLHQSGLQKFDPKDKDHSTDNAVHTLQEQGLQPHQFRVHQYNDANYIVLARVIETIEKEPLQQYISTHFIKKFQLNRTAFYNNANYKQHMAIGYDQYKMVNTPKFLDQYDGAGNLYMSPKDMGLLVLALQQNKILPKDTTSMLLNEVRTKQFPNAYRYGFYANGVGNRLSGIFYGQQYTCYFNQEYIVVLATNFQKTVGQNEVYIEEIFTHMLHQKNPNRY